MRGLIKIGDYVQYLGNYRVEGVLREPGIGHVQEFHTPFEEERIYLHLPDRGKHIWCDYRDIRVIETNEEHLKKLGFTVVPVGQNNKYEILGITISQTVIKVTLRDYRLTGLCVCDFSQPQAINWKKYIIDDDFNMVEFYKDYPYVGDVNRLLDYWESTGRQVKRETIVM